MKTRILITLVFSVLIASATFAESEKRTELTNCQVDVQLTAENQIVVRYISESKDKVRLLVFDDEGNILVQKKFCKSGHVKYTFDISKLSGKNLEFKVIANKQTVCTENVTINDKGIASVPTSAKGYDLINKKQEYLLTETK